MSIRYSRVLLTGLGLAAALSVSAQSASPAHKVFLLGNTAGATLPARHLQALRRTLEQQTGPFTVVHLGDVVGPEGLGSRQDSSRSGQTERIDALIALVQGLPNGKLYFVPGDRDWANSGPDGLKRVRRLEKYIEEHNGKHTFVPENGCPGPYTVDVAPLVRLVALNSPWFTHPYDKPEAPDTDCKTLTQEEFREQLQDVLDETKGRNVLVVGHQPVVSNGEYGGHLPAGRYLWPPVVGAIDAAYRQNVGTPRDLANPRYQQFQKEILNTLRDHPGAVYAAAHDYSLQLTPRQGSFHLVAGSFAEARHVATNGQSQYNAATEGFSELDYYADGTVKTTFFTFDEGAGKSGAEAVREAFSGTLFQSACQEPRLPNVAVNSFIPECPSAPRGAVELKPDAPFQTTQRLPAGAQYAGTRSSRFWLGPAYRTSWTQPVAVRTLDLNTERGGLRAFGRGGGRQTTSLKLIAADSSEYVFRSVDKDVTRILPPELRTSFAADVLRDITPTAHPYSALVISSLLDKTDILHARPRLFVLPDNQQLGPYRAEYAGLLGTLEDRPQDPKPNLPGFGQADNIRRSFSFFRQLYKDNDNRIDAVALGRARAFDMLVADFGKHEDNWKWAAYEDGKKTVYKPIPRDRDQAFTLWNGALTYLANREWALPSIEGFQDEFQDMKSLNWPARHLDRFLLQSLNREQWQEIARYLQERITPAAIDEATATLPPELKTLSADELNRKLKARIQQLPQALDRYYLLLAKRVDVVGSNKAEVFQVNRQPDGRVRVQLFDKAKDGDGPNGPALFDRTFRPRETEEISLYGLDGKDVFTVTGTADRSILVRVIGGAGQDRVADDSRVSGLRTLTKVYDVPDTDLALGPEADNRTSRRPGVNTYDREQFEFNSYRPSVGLGYNRNDGLTASAGVTFLRQGFRKPDYKNQYNFLLEGSTGGQRQFTATTRHRYAIGKVDVGASFSYGSYFPFYNFFGLGNNTALDQDQYDNRFYRARYKGIQLNAFFERTFFQRSVLRVGPTYEYYNNDFANDSYLGLVTQTPAPGDIRPNTDFQRLVGLNALLDLDLRDRQSFAHRGIRLLARHDSYQQLSGNQGRFGLTQGSATYYGTARLLIPVTLVVKGGGARNYGNDDDIPFYKFASLGLREGLRGFYRNRFSGDASLYLNTELRLALGHVQTSFLPFSYGVFGFYDRGRVYFRGDSPGGWHQGYGAGFYIAPVSEQLAFSVSYQKSVENNLLQFGLGFRIDQ
ncbi:outer membrane protein assembly factor [Hymenobacter sp. NST-14]|uniref:outer membrane protein assembly factor n=1 Tax=Hymenobacter piscis TaxID=2839984 RepID=UPI001C01DD1D|nr:outer membrane protein assembly factor [Hymenobacter piscis]MBT9395524.1 outer membrane protein assembly factor [Hymenobacter piscis]